MDDSTLVQGTDEWRQARVGYITGSRFGDVMTKGRGKGQEWGDMALSYLYELVGEQLTGEPADDGYTSKAMQWGNDHEHEARTVLEFYCGGISEMPGFIKHPDIDGVGVSPDGYDGESLIEIKCPYTLREHVRTLVTRQVPKQYYAQVQGGMWVTEKMDCLFCSYHPTFPERFRLVALTVDRDEAFISELSNRVMNFRCKLLEIIARLEGEA